MKPVHTIFGIAGWKNSGKTTLVEALVREFCSRGLKVSTVKHAHHAFDIDTQGKDSHRHRMAGASEVLVASQSRWALIHELRFEEEAPLSELLQHLQPCDLVLVEGFKAEAYPKLEVLREIGRQGRIADLDPSVRAVATFAPEIAGAHRFLHLDDVHGIADFIAAEVCVQRSFDFRTPSGRSRQSGFSSTP